MAYPRESSWSVWSGTGPCRRAGERPDGGVALLFDGGVGAGESAKIARTEIGGPAMQSWLDQFHLCRSQLHQQVVQKMSMLWRAVATHMFLQNAKGERFACSSISQHRAIESGDQRPWRGGEEKEEAPQRPVQRDCKVPRSLMTGFH